MRYFRWFVRLLSAVPLLANAQGKAGEQMPNIVFIFADDMGYGDVSALNPESRIITKNIDRIASEGVVFTDAHASASVSTPSRYSLLTGRYNWRSTLKEGVLNGYSKPIIEPMRRTFAQMLHDAGYNTACIGKWHLGWEWNNVDSGPENIDYSKPITAGPLTKGFDYFFGIAASLDMPPYVYVENYMPTAVPIHSTGNHDKFTWWRDGPTADDFVHADVLPKLIDKAVEYISSQVEKGNTFCLYLPLNAPHTPILPTDDYLGKSGLNPYGDYVMMIDDLVGKLLQTLQEQGIADNTIVVFTTDNGCSPEADIDALQQIGHYPSYIYRGYKADLYDGGHRIPCVLSWGSNINHHVVEQTICLTDFYATFAALCGHQMQDDEGEDSYNLLPYILNSNMDAPAREATVHHSIYGDFSIRYGEWKLLMSPSSGGWSYPCPGKDDAVINQLPRIQLYNLIQDPKESNNIYQDHPDVVAKLRQLLIDYINNGRSTPGAPQTNDGEKLWKQINWI